MSRIYTDVGCGIILPQMTQIYTDVGCVIILPRMTQIYTDVGCVIILPQMSQIYTDLGCVIILPQMSQIFTDVGCVIILPQMSQIYTDIGCVRKNTNSTNYTNAAQKNLWESVISVGEYPQAKSVRIRVICGRISSGKICGNPCDLWENILKQNLWEWNLREYN